MDSYHRPHWLHTAGNELAPSFGRHPAKEIGSTRAAPEFMLPSRRKPTPDVLAAIRPKHPLHAAAPCFQEADHWPCHVEEFNHRAAGRPPHAAAPASMQQLPGHAAMKNTTPSPRSRQPSSTIVSLDVVQGPCGNGMAVSPLAS